ncbi:MAG TPA: hypothetical protein VFY47_02915 [Thermoleophilaceae bacterium]|nr:hypothetical protein [Thermoleophilaceae bacterium]
MNSYRHRTLAACLVALVLALAAATQANAQSIVQVDIQGGGSGRVTGQEGINCPGVCWADMEGFYDVVYAAAGLQAKADPGSIFAGWGGACLFTGTSPNCYIPRFYNATRTAIARFERLTILKPSALTVTVSGTGAGTVTAPGIACPGDCAQAYVKDAQVTLSASPAAGSSFAGWSGACSGSAPECTVTMSAAKSVAAQFTADPATSGGETGAGAPGSVSRPRGDCTIRGTRGADLLVGTRGRDVICGLGGKDRLIGRAGNDVLRGGPGADYLRGGRGRDLLNGGTGVDRAIVVSGTDTKRSVERVL